MSYVIVDVESDGPIPGDYSMICFAAVLVTPTLDKTFYGKLRPISEKWIPEALAVSGFSRDAVMQFDAPEKVMADFRDCPTKIWISTIVMTTDGRLPFNVAFVLLSGASLRKF